MDLCRSIESCGPETTLPAGTDSAHSSNKIHDTKNKEFKTCFIIYNEA